MLFLHSSLMSFSSVWLCVTVGAVNAFPFFVFLFLLPDVTLGNHLSMFLECPVSGIIVEHDRGLDVSLFADIFKVKALL